MSITQSLKAEKTSVDTRSRNDDAAAYSTTSGFPKGVDTHSLALVLILIVAAQLRFFDLDRNSIDVDEAVSWRQASQPFLEMLAATARDNYPPLHNIILKLTTAVFGDSETALRAPSALLGVGTIYLLYRLGTLLWDRTTGLIAALLLALSGFHVWYSTEARMYALLSFTATLFVLTVVQATRRPNWITLAGCAAAGTALLYSHVYGSFIFAGVSLYVCATLLVRASWINVGWQGWIVSQAVAVALFLPWAVILFGRARYVLGGFWLPEPTPEFLLKQLAGLVGGKLALPVLGILAILSATNVAALRARYERADPAAVPESWLRLDWKIGMLLVWLMTPIVIGYFISLASQPIFHGRYLLGALPAVLLLAARGLASLPPRLMALAVAGVVLVFLPDLRRELERTRPDHRTAMQEFSKRYEPSDRVIYIGLARIPSRYYFRQDVKKRTKYSDFPYIPTDELDHDDRLWLIIRKKTGKTLSNFLDKAQRTHRVMYSITTGKAPIYLLQKPLAE